MVATLGNVLALLLDLALEKLTTCAVPGKKEHFLDKKRAVLCLMLEVLELSESLGCCNPQIVLVGLSVLARD